MKNSIIPQVIIPVSNSSVAFLQGISELSTECLKECQAIWVTMKQLENLQDVLDEELSTEYCYLVVLSRKFQIERVCFSAMKDLHTLKDCNMCIHFHEGAIIK